MELLVILGGIAFVVWGIGSFTQSNLTIREAAPPAPTPQAGCLGGIADLLMIVAIGGGFGAVAIFALAAIAILAI